MTSSVVFFSVFALILVANLAVELRLRYWKRKRREAMEEAERIERILKARRERKGW